MSTMVRTCPIGNQVLHVQPLHSTDDYDSLIALIGEARYVLIGEATHGSREFYHERAEITKRLIAEKGFTAVAVEADWPDAYRINRYVRGLGEDADADAALGDFRRFPTWMWRNHEVHAFVEWLHTYNATSTVQREQVGFYGLDLYSLHASMQAVLRYLDTADPEAARRARTRYSCFEHFGEDSQAYGRAASFGLSRSCEDDVVRELTDLQARAADYASLDGRVAEDEYFFAEQNARLARNAEHYYRSMFHGKVSSWNLRDRHMAETVEALSRHLDRRQIRAKMVIWEHNSHIGDARATELSRGGELNVGQLMRERYARETFLVGFSTFSGTVTAASDWDEPPVRMTVRPALAESYEMMFHQAGVPRFLLPLHDQRNLELLRPPRLERAIGVIYRPESERISHYFLAHLTDQFDALVHLDQTNALEPLERTVPEDTGEVPETYPSAM
jgi:erythromycin esterase-like protein